MTKQGSYFITSHFDAYTTQSLGKVIVATAKAIQSTATTSPIHFSKINNPDAFGPVQNFP